MTHYKTGHNFRTITEIKLTVQYTVGGRWKSSPSMGDRSGVDVGAVAD